MARIAQKKPIAILALPRWEWGLPRLSVAFFVFALAAGILLGRFAPALAMSSARWWVLIFAANFALLWFCRWSAIRSYALLIFLFSLGFIRIGASYDANETRFIEYRDYGEVTGEIAEVTQSASAALRIRLRDAHFDGDALAGDVRIALHGEVEPRALAIGNHIAVMAHISPPSAPAQPGGFDFRDYAWREGLAAVGYARKDIQIAQREARDVSTRFARWRQSIAWHYQSALADPIGGFAAAIFIGDRSRLDLEVVEAMRKSNLAHLLAISGMHMGIVMTMVYFLAKSVMILGALSVRRPIGIGVSAVLAILAGAGYWLASGMSISATRAFLMAAGFFIGLALGRRAISLRMVALAAIAILLVDPNALFDIGFQLSFAATTALVVFFTWARPNLWRVPKLIKWPVILMLTSLIAGFATAPLSAYYFHTMPKYGLIANLIAVPIMTYIVLPAWIASILFSSLGLESVFLAISGWGIENIIAVGEWVSGFREPVWMRGAAASGVLPAIIILGACAFFAPRIVKIFAILALIALLAVWPMAKRPMLLVSDDGRFYGLRIDQSPRQFSRATGHQFVAKLWAQSDGMPLDRETQVIESADDPQIIALGSGWHLVFTTTKKGAEEIAPLCRENVLIIAAQARRPKGKCLFFNQYDVADLGGFAADIEEGALQITPNKPARAHPWRQ